MKSLLSCFVQNTVASPIHAISQSQNLGTDHNHRWTTKEIDNIVNKNLNDNNDADEEDYHDDGNAHHSQETRDYPDQRNGANRSLSQVAGYDCYQEEQRQAADNQEQHYNSAIPRTATGQEQPQGYSTSTPHGPSKQNTGTQQAEPPSSASRQAQSIATRLEQLKQQQEELHRQQQLLLEAEEQAKAAKQQQRRQLMLSSMQSSSSKSRQNSNRLYCQDDQPGQARPQQQFQQQQQKHSRDINQQQQRQGAQLSAASFQSSSPYDDQHQQQSFVTPRATNVNSNRSQQHPQAPNFQKLPPSMPGMKSSQYDTISSSHHQQQKQYHEEQPQQEEQQRQQHSHSNNYDNQQQQQQQQKKDESLDILWKMINESKNERNNGHENATDDNGNDFSSLTGIGAAGDGRRSISNSTNNDAGFMGMNNMSNLDNDDTLSLSTMGDVTDLMDDDNMSLMGQEGLDDL